MTQTYETAKQQLVELNISKCEQFFKENQYTLELGYCKLLKGDLKNAKKMFSTIANISPRAHWALRLIQFMEGFVSFLPTYFEVRNFLEIDINLLLKSNQIKFVENIINGDDLFYSVNSESYKFIARVLIYNGYPEISKIYLDKGIAHSYTDPELHIIICDYYIYKNDIENAIKSLETCLRVLPNYYPAIKKLEELIQK